MDKLAGIWARACGFRDGASSALNIGIVQGIYFQLSIVALAEDTLKLVEIAKAAHDHADINSTVGCYEAMDKLREALKALESGE